MAPAGFPLTRRQALAGGAALAVAGPLAAGPGPAAASTMHTLVVGGIAVSVLSDGHLDLPRANFGRDLDPAVLEAALKASGATGERVKSATNVTLVRTGSELVLIDAGAGRYFMDTAGKLSESLEAAGVDPGSVTKVVFTHGHPDHMWGTFDDFDDGLRFPNAQYLVCEAEWALWMTGDPTGKVPADRQSFIPGAKRSLTALKDRIKTFKPGAELAPGLSAVDTAGHTQGHTSILVAAAGQQLMVLGDALTNTVISVQHPEWKPAADHEPDRAIATRKALLDRLATDKVQVIGYHFPFPGVGRIERSPAGFRYLAGS
jgi:glyoxylase-like metal-dependent hydrolase (beta-lactamase superfamily II)